MDEKSLQVLEYPKVLERLARHTVTPMGRERALALRPTASLRRAQARLAETAAARQVRETHPTLSLRGARDLRPALEAAQRGRTLSPQALLEVKDTLRVARTLHRALRQGPLSHHAAALQPPEGLIEAISQVVDEEGRVPDDASPELARLRSAYRATHRHLLDRLERMTRDPKVAPMLQEPIVTQRAGRYVLPLKADFKGQLPGLVHDQSASGLTLFVEPLAVVEANNRLRELERAAEEEIQRLLRDLTRRVAEHAASLQSLLDALGTVDLLFAQVDLAEEMEATQPQLVPFRRIRGKGPHPGSVLHLLGARHPLLDPEQVVPIDLVLDDDTWALVLTGPNTGGKTVTLKTAGLLAAMAQSGLFIPAEAGSRLTVFTGIYADIGDEQSIEQSLSTFSGHLRNILRILKRADRRSLVLLDELGAGTDPQEGAALARAILDHLVQRGVTTLVATHYPELKAYAHATPGVVNASVEFDVRTLRPTYRLTIGLPGRSNALLIAQRLGLPREILEAARQAVNPADLQADDLLDDIHRQRRIARRERRRAERERQRAAALRKELDKRLQALEAEREEILARARAEAQEELARLRAEVRRLQRRLAVLGEDAAPVQAVAEEVQRLEQEAREAQEAHEEALAPYRPPVRALPLQVGRRVYVTPLDAQGEVVALDGDEAEVLVGAMRVRVPVRRLRVLGEAEPPHPSGEQVSVRLPEVPSPGVELHLRGLPVDEALEALERYIDQAYLAGLPFVRIVHGKGTGKLRAAVRDALRRHPHVVAVEPALPQEGGEGATIAKLAHPGEGE